MNTTMNKEKENLMLDELGLNNSSPYTVPEGYFDTLTSRVMDRIDSEMSKEEKPLMVIGSKSSNSNTWKYAIRWMVAAAACIVMAIVGIQYYNNDVNTLAQNQIAEIEVDGYDEEYEEDVIYYSMVDAQDVYSYLAGIE